MAKSGKMSPTSLMMHDASKVGIPETQAYLDTRIKHGPKVDELINNIESEKEAQVASKLLSNYKAEENRKSIKLAK